MTATTHKNKLNHFSGCRPALLALGVGVNLGLAVFAIMTKLEILLFLVGIIYVIETASVILQVAYFKKTGKRIFLMTPIHHHFEKKGWNEKKIVGVFTFITVLACVIAYFAL